MEKYSIDTIITRANTFFGVDVRKVPVFGEPSWDAKLMTIHYLVSESDHSTTTAVMNAVEASCHELSLLKYEGAALIGWPKEKRKYLALKRFIEE